MWFLIESLKKEEEKELNSRYYEAVWITYLWPSPITDSSPANSPPFSLSFPRCSALPPPSWNDQCQTGWRNVRDPLPFRSRGARNSAPARPTCRHCPKTPRYPSGPSANFPPPHRRTINSHSPDTSGLGRRSAPGSAPSLWVRRRGVARDGWSIFHHTTQKNSINQSINHSNQSFKSINQSIKWSNQSRNQSRNRSTDGKLSVFCLADPTNLPEKQGKYRGWIEKKH